MDGLSRKEFFQQLWRVGKYGAGLWLLATYAPTLKLADAVGNYPLFGIDASSEMRRDGSNVASALNDILTEADTNQQRVFFSRAGTYGVERALTPSDKVHIIGGPGVVLQATEAIPAIISQTSVNFSMQNFHVESLELDANGLASNCILITNISIGNTVGLFGIRAKRAVGDGVVSQKCQGGIFEAVLSHDNGGRGFYLQGCNASTWLGLHGSKNGGDGFEIASFKDDNAFFSGGCTVKGVRSENNTGHGIYVSDTTTLVSLDGGWIERNDGDGVRLEALAVVQDLFIKSGGNPDTTFAIHCMRGSDGSVCKHNEFYRLDGSGFKQVKVEAGVNNVHVRHNKEYVTANNGTATVPNGSTSVSVSHGLDVTPSLDDIKVTPTNDLGKAAKWWISNPTASSFDINVDVNPGEATATFTWSIIVQ